MNRTKNTELNTIAKEIARDAAKAINARVTPRPEGYTGVSYPRQYTLEEVIRILEDAV